MRLARLTKKLDERKKALRKDFFAIADQEIPNHLRPMASINVPFVFFETTGISHKYFVESRFPAWELIHTFQDEAMQRITFTLLKKPEFIGYTGNGEGVAISRSVSEMTPEVDWDTMRAEDVHKFEMFAKPVITYELDTTAFQEAMKKDPTWDAQGFLMRHSKHKMPTLRVLAKELEDA